MTEQRAADIDQTVYWNEDGGQRWVLGIEKIEAMLAPLSEHLITCAAAPSGARVLDVGCGGGVTSAALAAAVGLDGHVLGVDVSAVILDVARRRYGGVPNLAFMTADAGSCAFEPASFDLILSRFGVMFFPEPVAAFANLRRAAKPDARLLFMCWRRLDENPWMGVAAAAAFTVIPPPAKPAPGSPGPFSFADPRRVSTILTDAGFADIAFAAHDRPINLGTVDSALEWLTHMGPAATPLREAASGARKQALAAMRAALEPHATVDGVLLTGATWLVEARAR